MPTKTKEHNIRPELVRLAVPIESVSPHPDNPRRGNIDGIASSLERFGQMRPILVQQSTRRVVAGNHTRYGAQRLGWTHIAAVVIDMTDDEALSYLIADNRWSDLATYDDEGLVEVLKQLEAGGLLTGTGYTDTDLSELEKMLAEAQAAADDQEPRGEKLKALNVSVAEPDTELSHGAIVRLGKHTLVVAGVYDGWPLWSKYLTDGVLFVPYPTPTLPMTRKAETTTLVLVQPDPYLAGHLVDKFKSVYPDEAVSVL